MPLVSGELTRIDNVTRVLSCPWYLTGCVAVRWVSEMYEWRELGNVPFNSLPVYGRRAVTAFGRGVSRRQSVDMEKAREEAERKRGK